MNHVLREEGVATEEDPTFQYMIEAFHPQNNGLFRLWTRFMLSSYSEEQVTLQNLTNFKLFLRLMGWLVKLRTYFLKLQEAQSRMC